MSTITSLVPWWFIAPFVITAALMLASAFTEAPK